MQTWFITGASGGLGSRITRRLLDRGDRVAATVRKPGVLDDLQAQYGSQLWQANLDLTNSQQIAEVVERAFLELGTTDGFVNNAAYGLYGEVEEASDRQFEHQFIIHMLLGVASPLYLESTFYPLESQIPIKVYREDKGRI